MCWDCAGWGRNVPPPPTHTQAGVSSEGLRVPHPKHPFGILYLTKEGLDKGVNPEFNALGPGRGLNLGGDMQQRRDTPAGLVWVP